MARKFLHFTWTDRLIIEKLYNGGMSQREIARRLGFSSSSMSVEVRRGLYDHLDGQTWKTEKRYSAQIAQDVACGHPDKICDQVADAIVTDCLRHDKKARVAIECLIKDNHLIVAGELTSTHKPDYRKLVMEVLRRIHGKYRHHEQRGTGGICESQLRSDAQRHH